MGRCLLGLFFLGVAMTEVGPFFRGPGGQWFWPGKPGDHNRLIYEVNRDLPDLFGITSNLGKAIFGAAVVGGFFAIGGFLVHALYRRYNAKNYQRKSFLQYSILMVFFLTIIALPIKMLPRIAFHTKYVWITARFDV